jgi:hypothetical protein
MVMEKLIPVVIGFALLAGCAKHYQISDTSSGKTYYAKGYDESRRTGQVSFKDAKSGSKVSLDSAEIKKISKSEFKDATDN